MNTKELKEKLYRQVENLDYESALKRSIMLRSKTLN